MVVSRKGSVESTLGEGVPGEASCSILGVVGGLWHGSWCDYGPEGH